MTLTEEQALRAYATTMNTLGVAPWLPLLADDFHYASYWVFAEIESNGAFLNYIFPKLDTIRHSGARLVAEMAWLDEGLPGPCVVTAQNQRDNLLATVLVKVQHRKFARLDMCGVPSPHPAHRSGEYPGPPGEA